MAFKVFTNGSTLQASEVNDNLMRQAVATFSNAAARTAAIPSPSEGMLTYLEDIDRYQWWTGTAWRSPFGATLVAYSSFSAQTSMNFDNVFTSEFDTYRIDFLFTNSAVVSNFLQLRAGGSNLGTATYDFSFSRAETGAVSQVNGSSLTQWTIGRGSTTSQRNLSTIIVSNPAVNGLEKGVQFQCYDRISTINLYDNGGGRNVTTLPHDGFRLFPGSGTCTGTISVYGMRK
jgi:hypothetical protein